MDLSDGDAFRIEKRDEDHLSYQASCLPPSDWQYHHQIDTSPLENPMNSSSSSHCPSASMADSFCQGLFDPQSNPQNHVGKPLPVAWNSGLLPASLAHLPANSGFVERAARFSCFSGGSFSGLLNSSLITAHNEPLSPYPSTSNPMIDQKDNRAGNNETSEAQLSGGVQENSSSGGNGAKKRKRTIQDMESEQAQGSSPTKENLDNKQKAEQHSSTKAGSKSTGKNTKESTDGAKEDYIHVRARRGQATNSHSLAERVRREKISERMKFLQDLVPGCSKVTGKAVMLDEIINYVQSLQRQVEFLSMKLAAVNPRLDLSIEGLLSKELLHLRSGSSSAIGFLPEMIHSQLHPSQQGLIQAGVRGMVNHSDALRRPPNTQMAPMMPNAWEDELHNVIQMNYGSNLQLNTQELDAKPQEGFPLE